MADSRNTVDVVCLGEAMVEFNQTSPTDYVQGFGGDTSNAAIAAVTRMRNPSEPAVESGKASAPQTIAAKATMNAAA